MVPKHLSYPFSKPFTAILLIGFSFLISSFTNAQPPTALPLHQWNAYWIAAPGDNGTDYGVYYFRKTLHLDSKPTSFVVHVSADNRYKLYVNGKLASLGPARGDIYNWNYETTDLAPYLTKGENTIAALVWNEAQYRPEAQITVRTGFILQGNTAEEEELNTNSTWVCKEDKGHHPFPTLFAASTGEWVNMKEVPKDWMLPQSPDSSWQAAVQLDVGHPKGTSDGFGWMLVPSPLPQMEVTEQRIPLLRTASGVQVPSSFPKEKTPFTIPANTTATLLLDQTFETNAYIHFLFSKGAGAGISIGYAEAMYEQEPAPNGRLRKGNRDEVTGKRFIGRKDSVTSDGSNDQLFTSLYWRSFRYIQLTIHTKDEPLTITDFRGSFTGYPFQRNDVFTTDKKEIKQILDIGWRTARLDAMETYFDCPYYEQLQYIGDTRIQAMISYYNSGDDRLARNALTLMDHSRLPEGVTLSRYPTHSTQVISTFSLWYIGMLHDYWMYRNDSSFIQNKLTGARDILTFFAQYQGADGSLQHLPYWTFVDWAEGNDWNWGSSPKGKNGGSAVFDLQLLWAYQWEAQMEAAMGLPDYASLYTRKAAQLAQTIKQKYWDANKGLFADTEEKKNFSQHANSLAVLTGLVPQSDLKALGKKLLSDSSLTQCTIYFRYYLHQALVKAGLGDDYQNWLGTWRDNIAMGLTTWAEEPNLQTTRSDCHAWGASPNIEYYRTVLGIDSDAPGFSKIKIEPHLGDLTNVSGEIPHPNGKISVRYAVTGPKWNITVSLPPGTSGTFLWKGKTMRLHQGQNSLSVE